jgi:hypothetical protein
MEASIMNDNVIAFPRTAADVADAERAARLDRIENWNEATRLAYGGGRFELKYVEDLT